MKLNRNDKMYFRERGGAINLQKRSPNIYALMYDEFNNHGKVHIWNRLNNRKSLRFNFKKGFHFKQVSLRPLFFKVPTAFISDFEKICDKNGRLTIFYNGLHVPIAVLEL